VSLARRVVGITPLYHGVRRHLLAVASNTANFVLGELVRHGHVRRAYIGVAAQQTVIPAGCACRGRDAGEWLVAVGVEPGSPAELGRCAAGDIILALDGVAISGADDLIRVLVATRSGVPCRSSAAPGRAAACGHTPPTGATPLIAVEVF